MTENKTTEVIESVSKQVRQTWTKVQPQLRSLSLKLVKSLLPALQSLQTKLVKSDVKTDATIIDGVASSSASSSNPTLNKALQTGRIISSKAIAVLIIGLTKLQQSLDNQGLVDQNLVNQESILDESGNPVALLNAVDEPVSPMVAQAQQEFGIAWKFVKEQVTPKVLAFLQSTVDKLDPIATNIWQKASIKAAATPSLVNSWQKLQDNDIWKKTVTATAPIWRSMTGIAAQIPLSERVQAIVSKRAGTIALVTLFSLFLVFKPSLAHGQSGQNIKKVTTTPVAISKTSQKQPIAVNDLVAPKTTEVPLTAEQVAIAKVQTQVTEVASQYGESLLGSVQTNFKRGRLVVALSDGWYQLDEKQQTQLVTDLQNRSRSLNFKKLLVADAEDHLIARSPVTGSEVIILRH